ncbi:hypothetical protein CEXT_400191 [Caerostris extrusa]|uniref:Uncharacterized protein n=1 Tax=Caerostris extrusa TaxID=172846 RepID=A0AAV4XYH8_CAEEX|nr:hypothetical protein CEXT_400191 [Caerostris extrusa]
MMKKAQCPKCVSLDKNDFQLLAQKNSCFFVHSWQLFEPFEAIELFLNPCLGFIVSYMLTRAEVVLLVYDRMKKPSNSLVCNIENKKVGNERIVKVTHQVLLGILCHE